MSKLTIAVGLGGLALVWWQDHGAQGETRPIATSPAPATSAPSSNGYAPPAAVPAASAPALVAPSATAANGSRALPPLAAFGSMVDRPLFAPDRRPLPPPPEGAEPEFPAWTVEPAAGPDLPAVQFIGSIEENGRVRALLGNGQHVRGVGLGDTVDGWTVLAIDARRLTLGLAGERLELTILE